MHVWGWALFNFLFLALRRLAFFTGLVERGFLDIVVLYWLIGLLLDKNLLGNPLS